MNKSARNKHPLFKIANDALVDLPTPSTISGWWNFGSLLGICLVAQIATGLFLAMHYCPDIDMAFSSVSHIFRDVNYGWLLRTLHAKGASLFFVCIYLHTGRNMYYGSYNFMHTWSVGVVILFLTINSIYSVRIATSTNIILSCNCNYKPPISHSMRSKMSSTVGLSGVCCS